LAWVDRALALRPECVAAVSSRANSLIHLLRYAEAEAQLANQSNAVAEHSGYWSVKGSLQTHRGELDEALATIMCAIDLSDDDDATALGYKRMGELLIALEDDAHVLDVAERRLELRLCVFCLQELKAKALCGLGREGEADEIERAVQARLIEQRKLLDQAEGAQR
jgi:hypothetical protein